MKGLLFVFLIASLSGAAFSWSVYDWVDADECQVEGEKTPHQNCTLFYTCSNGELIVEPCPVGTYFSPAAQQCDFPAQVPECIAGTRPPPTDGTTLPSNTTATTTTTTQSSNSTTTTQSSNSTTTAAPTTLNATTTTQAPPTTPEEEISTIDNRNTTSSPINSTTTPSDQTTPETAICVDEDDVYTIPVAGNCSLYILCAFGEPIQQTCPQGTYYDIATGTCNKADEVERCSAPICGANETVFKPVPGNCAEFIICAHGNSSIRTCPEGTLFDPVLLQCNLAENVDCQGSNSTVTLERSIISGVAIIRNNNGESELTRLDAPSPTINSESRFPMNKYGVNHLLRN